MASSTSLGKQGSFEYKDGHYRCGYPVYQIENLAKRWICPYCHYVMKEPYQLHECGHRVCKGCFESRAAEAVNGLMICPDDDCGVTFGKDQFMLDRAFKRELDNLPVVCDHKLHGKCDWSGPLKSYQEHRDAKHIHYPCDLCPEEFRSYQELLDHIGSTCASRFRACPLGQLCTKEMIRIEEFSSHLLGEQHQESIVQMLIGKHSVEEMPDQDQDMEADTAITDLEKETSEKLSRLAEAVQNFNDDTVELNREFIKLNELTQVAMQDLSKFQTAISDRNSVMNTLQNKQQTLQKEIEQAKQTLEEHQYVSTDGTLTWRVDRVAERMADAQSERQTSIYSPIFYSMLTGYKMRARLYLHGDGNARRTHISLFFLLMKGDYDVLLPWPFGYKVTFCLFDQTGNNRHIIDSFRPDTKSSSFQRPKTDTNVASGIPKFFPLPMIQQDDNAYVRDDTLFLKIIVDINETPKILLPFTLNLNPGLPYHVQQNLINQEKIKQQANALATTTSMPINTCG